MKAIINARIYDYKNYIENGYLLYDHQIVAVGPMEEFRGHFETYDARGKLILPGLLNGHTHIYSTLFRGCPLIASPTTFTEVLEQTWWTFDRCLDLDAVRTSAYAYARQSLEMGVTALIDHHASGTILNSLQTLHLALEDVGIKHLLCFETSNRFNLEACIQENQYALRLRGHFGMHASMTLSESTLDSISAVLGDQPIHIHVAESKDDVQDAKEKYDELIVNRLARHGLLNPDSILGHCVHITDEEAALIKSHDCYVAINPTSNLNNAVGLYNYDTIASHKLNILVGTDGLGANVAKEYQYLYYLAKQKIGEPSGVPLDWVKDVIQIGYDYYNRRSQRRIGRLETGYDSDFIIIDYDFITPISDKNIFAHVFFGVFESMKPQSVYIDGEKLVDQYQYVKEKKEREVDVINLWEKL